MSVRLKELFNYDKKEEFRVNLTEWIGQVFYDILPEHGYDVREEQIYTAFQLADAVCNKKVHLAEAGLGTGKTFAYLLTAIAYARFSGKPVVIASASTALQEQLLGKEGDIQTLSHLLNIEIDARMAKDPRQYICDARVHESIELFTEESDEASHEIYQWLEKTDCGERSEIPLVPDRIWKKIGWDESMSCDICSNRGFCKLVRSREHYRSAKDLIIVNHEIFFNDLWTREDKIADGKLPILPSYSAVIFDEGHKVILPAAMQAGQQILKEDIDNIVFSLEQIQGARESLIGIVVELEHACDDFFSKLNKSLITDECSDRLGLQADDILFRAARTFHKALDGLLLEIQIEQELYIESFPKNVLQMYEAQIERATTALDRFYRNKNSDVITWVSKLDGSFWVVPKNLSKMLDEHLFQKGLPVVFTSATLSNDGDFSYFTRTLGFKNPSSSTVESSFNIEEQVVVYLSQYLPNNNKDFELANNINRLISLLKHNEGRALVLTNSLEEVRTIREGLKSYQLPFEVLWEDKGDRGYLIKKFREDVSSVLIGANFWEGIDIPGEGLSLLIIWKLPFPSLDPLIEVRRKEAKSKGLDPTMAVDYPEMGLKLKQGCGRLIRKKDDQGSIVFMESVKKAPWEEVVMGALPSGARIGTIEDFLHNTV